MGKKSRKARQSNNQEQEKPKPGGDRYPHARREAEARAGERARNRLPRNFSEIPRFTIDTREEEEGHGGQTLEEKLQRFYTNVTSHFDNVRSMKCEGISVTHPFIDEDGKTIYHIVIIESNEGTLEVLVRNVDGYVIAFREQQQDLNTKSGWYYFSDIELPAHLFGEEEENYRMTYDSGYSAPENVKVGEGFLDNAVKILLKYNKQNYKEETDERFMMLQTLFVVLGEGQRLTIIRRFLIRHLRDASRVAVGSGLAFWIKHWSKLSKGILYLKLFILANALEDDWKRLAAAVEATNQLKNAWKSLKDYKDQEIPLTANDFLKEGNLGRSIPTLARVAGDQLYLPLLISYVQLLKHEDLLVPHIIMRESGYLDVLPVA